jgi:hypothetical protein
VRPAKERREEAAARKLRLAKTLLESNPEAAQRRLQEVADKFDETAAAIEARRLLPKPEAVPKVSKK